MNRNLLWPALLASLLAVNTARGQNCALGPQQADAAPISNCDLGACPCGCGPARWTGGIDATWFHREGGSEHYLGRTFNVGTGATDESLSTTDSDFRYKSGLQLTLAYQRDDDSRVEFIYFGTNYWSIGRQITPVAGTELATSPWTQLDKATGIGGFGGYLNYRIQSKVHNVEWNYHQLWGGSPWTFSALGGVRYFQWDDAFSLTAVDPQPVTESIELHSSNHVLAAQFGGELSWGLERFSIAMSGKSGVGANFYEQRRQNNASDGGPFGRYPAGFNLLDDSDNNVGFAGIIDASLMAAFRATNHLAFRGGYRMVYLYGLALAASQYSGYSHGNDLLLYGPSTGLEFTW